MKIIYIILTPGAGDEKTIYLYININRLGKLGSSETKQCQDLTKKWKICSEVKHQIHFLVKIAGLAGFKLIVMVVTVDLNQKHSRFRQLAYQT